MKIAIDCRYIGKSGIGRVCEGIINALDFSENEYYLIGKKSLLEKYSSAHIIEDETEPYSIKGLLSYNKKLNSLCEAIFIPNFLVPFGIKIPVYTIMHDLAFLDVPETTRGFADKAIKKYLLKRCMRKSKTVFCVSNFTRSRCEYYYKKLSNKCVVNYNGISDSVFEYAATHKNVEKENTIVFVGNVKPHKGLTTLLSAFVKANNESTLKIIGEKDNFLTGLDLDETAYKNVIFTGKLKDEELFSEIQRAQFLVLPSKYEGFGLPPLESLCLGTQPIVSDIEVFHEVYKGLPVVYFNGVDDLAEKLSVRPQPVESLNEIAEKYNYHNCVLNSLRHISNRL